MAKKYNFSFNEKEADSFEEFAEYIKKSTGKHGNYTFSFTPTGIGNSITVIDNNSGMKKNITDIDSW